MGMVHASFTLLPITFPESHWQQACELIPDFNELEDHLGFILGSVSSVIELFYSLNADPGWEFFEGNKPNDTTARKPHQIIVDWNEFRVTHFAPK